MRNDEEIPRHGTKENSMDAGYHRCPMFDKIPAQGLAKLLAK
jgi:hypothetical protein